MFQGLHDCGFRCFFIHDLSEEGGGKYLGCILHSKAVGFKVLGTAHGST